MLELCLLSLYGMPSDGFPASFALFQVSSPKHDSPVDSSRPGFGFPLLRVYIILSLLHLYSFPRRLVFGIDQLPVVVYYRRVLYFFVLGKLAFPFSPFFYT